MGNRNRTWDDAQRAVGTDPVEIFTVPANACDGQMDFRNIGATSIALRFGRGPGDTAKSTVKVTGPYTVLLNAGEAFTEDGVVNGSIVAVSSAVGGILSSKVTYYAP